MARPATRAQNGPAAEAATSVPPDMASFLRALPKWTVFTALNASYGYKDNLLLSYADEERSAFVRGSADLMLMRAPRGPFEYTLFFDAERTHYFTAPTSDHDAKVWIRTEPAYRLGKKWRLGLPLTGFYYDQVFDQSDTDVERLIARTKVEGVMAGPTVRWDFHPSWWIEAQAVGQKKRYEDGSNDGRTGEGNLSLAWSAGSRFEATISGGRRWRDFAQRSQYSASGRELPGTELKISEREGELRFDIWWDEATRWKTTTRASHLRYRDNGSGFFDFREEKVAQELKWTDGPWLVRVKGSASRLDFGVQTVGVGIDPPSRVKDEFTGDFHIERQLSKRWTVFGTYMWERSRSNDEFTSYTMNEGLLGIRWSWEK